MLVEYRRFNLPHLNLVPPSGVTSLEFRRDLWHQKTRGIALPFMWYKNIAGRFFGLVTKHACGRRTDGRTDRQNYDSHSIAESRGKNHTDIGLLLKCNVSSYRPNIPSQVQCNSVVKLQRSELTLTSALKDYNISRP